MKSKKSKEGYIIRLEKGDKVIESLVGFCRKKKIICGFFNGIGASSYTKLMHYDSGAKKYSSRIIKSPLEIVSLSGNVTLMDNDQYLHCHACLSDKNMKVYAGHLKEAIISATCEILLITSDASVKRRYDDKIGLNLMDL